MVTTILRRIDARSGGQGINISTDDVVQEGVWNHVVYTYTSDTLRIYVNGSEHKKMYKNYDWNRDISGSGSVYIGTYEPSNNPFLGSLDDIRFYNKALTASEISTLYSVESESSDINSITVPAGQTSNFVYVRPNNDDIYEVKETLKLSISSVDNGQAASSGTSVDFEIVDNEAIPKVTLSSDKDFIGENEEFKLATITATSTLAAGDTIKILLETDGTGEKDKDYVLSSDTIFILPGATSGSITVTAKWESENEITEGDETLIIDIKTVSSNALEDGVHK